MTLAERVAAHLALEPEAMPAPWRSSGSTTSVYVGTTGAVLADVHTDGQHQGTAAFIAASHDACALLREQRAEIEWLGIALKEFSEVADKEIEKLRLERDTLALKVKWPAAIMRTVLGFLDHDNINEARYMIRAALEQQP